MNKSCKVQQKHYYLNFLHFYSGFKIKKKIFRINN